MNRPIHLSSSGETVGRIHSGPDGSTSQRSDAAITPGLGTGTASDGVIPPALPAEAPDPHRSRSNTVTSQPRADSASAVHRPTAPPPITLTRTRGAYRANPVGNGSVGSSRYWAMPVIQARPLTSGTTAGVVPSATSSTSRPVK